ncbi:MAG: neutral zinc metallopeptidase [Synechocystis sp.]|nr:neutral zinc metallopeptidase [Synechocystis sp.]
MRWQFGRRSDNIEDRRGSGGGMAIGGGIGTIILALIALALGVDPSIVLQQSGNLPQSPPIPLPRVSTPRKSS